MAISTKKKEIDKHVVSVSTFPGRVGLKHKIKLVKLVAPSLASVLGSFKSAKDVTKLASVDLSPTMLQEAVKSLVDGMDADSTVSFILELLSFTTIDDKRAADEAFFDSMFAGEFGLLYKILYFVLEVNYASFFEGSGIGRLLKQGEEKKTPVPLSKRS